MTLAELKLGSLTLDPAFDPDETSYSCETSNASNKVTATATDEDSLVTIEANGAEIDSGDTVTWEDGENIVTVTVGNTGTTETMVYTVAVTKVTENPEE